MKTLTTATDKRGFLTRIKDEENAKKQLSQKKTVTNTRLPDGPEDPYVRAAISNEMGVLASTGAGSRNHQLNISALSLGRLPVERDVLRDSLIEACHTNGLIADDGITSVERTIASAYRKADDDGPREIPARSSASTAGVTAGGTISDEELDTVLDEDGDLLLDDLLATLTKYVLLPDRHAAVAVTLWIATTHALPAFECAPRLVATSPDKRCGKSRLLDIITATCHRSLATVNATSAAIFRSIGDEHPPTLIIDEADTLFGSRRVAENNEDLRALLNAGHQRGRPALRCVGPDQTPTPFPTFAMAAVAGIGKMPDTITDRAVNITMRRRAANEEVSQFRSRRDGPPLAQLGSRLASWAKHHLDNLSSSEPAMPVEDRAADTWEPLIAVADEAGGDWPTLARAACLALVHQAAESDEDQSQGVRLLADIQTVFDERGVAFLPSKDLANALLLLDESPWNESKLNVYTLAKKLKEFGIKPRHNTVGSARGYYLESFSDAVKRYLRQEPSVSSATRSELGERSDASLPSDDRTRQTELSVRRETADQTTNLTTLTLSDHPVAETVPGAPTSTTPGMTPRVQQSLEKARLNQKTA